MKTWLEKIFNLEAKQFQNPTQNVEQKKWERLPLLSIRFKVNYWILKKIGLVFYGILGAIIGALVTILFYECVFN